MRWFTNYHFSVNIGDKYRQGKSFKDLKNTTLDFFNLENDLKTC